MDALSSPDILLFGPFRFDRRGRLLFRCAEDGRYQPVSIGSRALTVLGMLTERPGDLVTKDEIIGAVWPGVVVEESNLTVQISSLRRILDAGSEGASCIQTVSGRGYRFVPPVMRPQEMPDAAARTAPANSTGHATSAVSGRSRIRSWHWLYSASAAVALALLLTAAGWRVGWFSGQQAPPRLSLVMLPFANLSGEPKDEYLADAITYDLTSDLSHISGALVIGRESAYALKGKAVDVRQIGQMLGVRYAIGGSVQRIEDTLRVNVQLTSADTGVQLWSDRFEERMADLNAGQEQIVTRMRSELGISMIEIEKVRSQRERPTNPDAFDLILRARSVQNLPPNPRRSREVLALYEQALQLDPSSAAAMANVAYYLLNPTTTGLGISFTDLQRAERLLRQARTIAPNSGEVLNYLVYWLSSMGRCQEARLLSKPFRWTRTRGPASTTSSGSAKPGPDVQRRRYRSSRPRTGGTLSVPISSGVTIGWVLHR
jgi:TolB-like protein/DNA-binding winged helix-turn-helix (wHTH) protein